MVNSSKIRLVSRAYDGMLPILRGHMTIPGAQFELIETEDVAGMFAGLFEGKYDIGEMSLGELIYYTSRDKADFVGIPVFPSRMFRHGFIFCRKVSGVRGPADLNGKRIGFLRWVQTAAIWMRGMLIDEYGLSAAETEWHAASMHHWDDADPDAAVEPRDGSKIRMIGGKGNPSERACRALFEGEVDALGVTESQLKTLQSNDSVKPLFDNPSEVEARYYQATRILPIMHVLAVRRDLVVSRPELPQKLFHLYCDAKRWARSWRTSLPSLVEAWPGAHLAAENAIFHATRGHTGSKLIGMCSTSLFDAMRRDQRAAVTAEELFHPSTLSLTE